MEIRRTARRLGCALILLPALAACGTDGGSADDPIKLGFSNMDTGNVSFPAITDAAEVAVKYLNEEKGGIAGRRVELEKCDLKNEDSTAQKCGQAIANDPDIAMGIVTMTNFGGPYYNAMKATDKPTLLGLAITPVDDTAPKTYSYLTSSSGTFVGYADYVKKKGFDSVAYIYHDDAAMKAAHKTFMGALGGGVDVKTTVTPTSASDILPQISASGANNADAVIVQAAGKCPQVAKAFQTLRWKPKVLTGGACLPPTQIADQGKLFDGWTLLGPIKLSAAGPDSDPDVRMFLEMWEKYGTGSDPGLYAELGWSTVMNVASAFEQAGISEITTENVTKALESFTGPSVMGPEKVSCPGPSKAPVACADQLISYSIADGTLTLEN